MNIDYINKLESVLTTSHNLHECSLTLSKTITDYQRFINVKNTIKTANSEAAALTFIGTPSVESAINQIDNVLDSLYVSTTYTLNNIRDEYRVFIGQAKELLDITNTILEEKQKTSRLTNFVNSHPHLDKQDDGYVFCEQSGEYRVSKAVSDVKTVIDSLDTNINKVDKLFSDIDFTNREIALEKLNKLNNVIMYVRNTTTACLYAQNSIINYLSK